MVKFVEASDVAFTAAAKVGAFKGAVVNLNNNVYHSLGKYWSSTYLKYMHRYSPAHFENHYISSKDVTDEPTKDMILGSLVHCMILEPKSFETDFFKMPDLNLRTNEGKATKQQLLVENIGRLAITDEMLFKAQCMRESVLANPKARALLEPGRKEASYFWTCPFSGLNFKAKLDQSSSLHFVELKTTRSAGMDAFSRHIDDMNYDLSLYHYREALRNVMDVQVPGWFIVVENEAPFVTQCYEAGESVWETGHAKWLDAVTKLEAGINKKLWPGYFPVEMDQVIQMPAWTVKKLGVLDGIS